MIITINSEIFRKPLTWIIIGLVSLILAVGGYYVYRFKPNFLSPIKDLTVQNSQTGQLSPDQTQKLLQEINKIIELPTGETPTVATITDISKLADQDFFKRAHNGDQVIIYTNARRAYLYSPTLKKILDVQPISIPAASNSAINNESEPSDMTPSTTTPTPIPATSSATFTP